MEWKCNACLETFSSRRKMQKHRKENGCIAKTIHYFECQCNFCGGKYFTKEAKTLHEKFCKSNPNHIPGKAPFIWSISQKEAQSWRLKKAYAEGRHSNDGFKQKQMGIASYPERWFMDVIQNYFVDKEYVYNFLFGKYRLDFAWERKLKCIEIDGETHQRYEVVKEKDKKRDEYLEENGWQILRLT